MAIKNAKVIKIKIEYFFSFQKKRSLPHKKLQ